MPVSFWEIGWGVNFVESLKKGEVLDAAIFEGMTKIFFQI